MKIDHYDPAFPVSLTKGITYRQWLVGMIAQGCMANPECIWDTVDDVTQGSICQADAIISALDDQEESA